MIVGKNDDFEFQYVNRFRLIAGEHGEFVMYERDRAARDIGLHFTQPRAQGGKVVTPSLAWFQLKGVQSSTLDREAFESAEDVAVVLERRHLAFWWLQPSPTYVAVYVECADVFLVLNIKAWVEKNIGRDILSDSQNSYTVRIPRSEGLDSNAFRIIMRENMIDVLKAQLEADSREARIVFRDAELIKRLVAAEKAAIQVRIFMLKYMSKLRTEVKFEFLNNETGEWELVRDHWQYMMSDLAGAFPFLEIKPFRTFANRFRTFAAQDDEEEKSDENYGYEEIEEIAPGVVSVGECPDGEHFLHYLHVSLNELGRRWAATLEALERANVIQISEDASGFVSVAPWHARQL